MHPAGDRLWVRPSDPGLYTTLYNVRTTSASGAVPLPPASFGPSLSLAATRVRLPEGAGGKLPSGWYFDRLFQGTGTRLLPQPVQLQLAMNQLWEPAGLNPLAKVFTAADAVDDEGPIRPEDAQRVPVGLNLEGSLGPRGAGYGCTPDGRPCCPQGNVCAPLAQNTLCPEGWGSPSRLWGCRGELWDPTGR
jgi:hypothetical protein